MLKIKAHIRIYLVISPIHYFTFSLIKFKYRVAKASRQKLKQKKKKNVILAINQNYYIKNK